MAWTRSTAMKVLAGAVALLAADLLFIERIVDKKSDRAKFDLGVLGRITRVHRTRTSAWPSGLNVLAEERLLETVPRDPWGNAYVTRVDAQGAFEITSLGADGAPGGSGEDADLRIRVQPSQELASWTDDGGL